MMGRARRIDQPPQGDRSEGPGVRPATPEDGRTGDRQAGHMELDRIIPDPDQPRKTFPDESLRQLAHSLKAAGQLQPIRVRWNAGHAKWVIISGERRYRAASLAGLKTIACAFVDRPLTGSEVRRESLIENLLREDLRPVEAAEGYRQLMEMNGWTMQDVAEALNLAKATVSKALSLLKLPEDVRARVNDGTISASAGYEVSRLPGSDAQRDLAARIVAEGLNRDQTGEAVGKAARPKAKGAGPRATTTRVLNVSGVRITMTWPKPDVEEDDVIEALEDALTQVSGELY
jgi:ParB family transcriptional regulator, chromosome partitioning protein